MKMNELLSHYRTKLGFVFAALFVVMARPTVIAMTVGIPIGITGLLIRLWASGYIKKNKELSIDGPYSYTRNPLYLGSFFIGLGVSIMGSCIVFILFYLAGFYLVYSSVIKDEEKSLIELFGGSFLDYKSKVPAFFPLMKPVKISKDFDLRLVVKHGEYNAWLGFAAIIIALYLKYHFHLFSICPL
ncbi:MAG: isoprenylcysteine carboxylmethyltransferase family protein [Deltaproteobacteria bacterium]|nr:isoprenylcysteine carboxylmethyltransferase family protein [Deltaproteobacteria bacterium]MCL5277786.1 isoprenylcysteine carboxylmethyltransferase family protein [Deltaproteobacteria bacterium]